MDFQRRYNFINRNLSATEMGALRLLVSIFESELHLSLLQEDRSLMAYQTFDTGRPVNAEELKKAISRLIAVTALIPNSIQVVDYNGDYLLVPKDSISPDDLVDLPLIQMKGYKRSLVNMSDRYDLAVQMIDDFEKEVSQIAKDVKVEHGVKHVHDLISVFKFESPVNIYLHIVSGGFISYLYRGDELLMCIQQPFRSVGDVAYYLLKMLELRQIGQGEPEVFIGGYITEEATLIDQLTIFFKKVNILILDGYRHLEYMPEITGTTSEPQ